MLETVAHYKLLDKLGEGGMGVVYSAQDTKLGRKVALKFLPEDAVRDQVTMERFLREARAAAALNHPNICVIYEVGEHANEPFIVLELLEGETLKHRLQRGALKTEQVLEIAIQIADGLAAAHAKGITHRDIKPANIFLNRQQQVKILDCGLAKLAHSYMRIGETVGMSAGATITGHDLTSPGTSLGTIAYMSPEQARGEDLDQRTDIFSFGTVLYEMATGKPAFSGGTLAIITDGILHNQAVPPSQVNAELPPEFDQIISKALEKDPDLRYQSAVELRTDLKRLKRDLESGRRSAAGKSNQSASDSNAALAAAERERDKSVAILYFENVSGSKEDEYFRDGITEDIITEISKIHQLRVFSRSEMLAFRDKPISAPQVGQQLGAAYVLEGSIRRSGNRVRISAQLVETASRRSIWAERHDRQMEDIFAIQDEIARSIAQALSIQLSPQEEKRIGRKPTENMQAYDFYLRGRNYCRRENLDFALQIFEQAIRLDPNFAMAHAGVANVCGMIYEFREQDQKWVERGLSACDRAMALDPLLPEALVARARLCYAEKKYEQGVQYALQAVGRKPDCEGAYNILARCYHASDRYQEVVELAERALEHNGDDYNIYVPIHNALGKLGEEKKRAALRDRGAEALERQLELVPEDVRARILLAGNYAEMGRESDSLRHVETAVALRPMDSNVLYNATCTLAMLGKKADALGMLQRCIEAGYGNFDWASRDPDLSSLHDEPLFQKLILRDKAHARGQK
jgi:non-specific serine/threonine protein kinase